MPDDSPERAVDVLLAVLRSETDTAVLAQLVSVFLQTLLYKHPPRIIDRIEAEALENNRLRWLLGGAWAAADESLRARLEHLTDTEAWRAGEDKRRTAAKPIHFPTL